MCPLFEPILIDDLPERDPGIPEYFWTRQCRRFPLGVPHRVSWRAPSERCARSSYARPVSSEPAPRSPIGGGAGPRRRQPLPRPPALRGARCEFLLRARGGNGGPLRARAARNAPVLFGRSGLGRTSLLRAGVFPMLREAGLLPIPMRLDSPSRAGALGAQVQAAIVKVIESRTIEARAPGTEQSLWECFTRPISGARATASSRRSSSSISSRSCSPWGRGMAASDPSSPSWPISSRTTSPPRCGRASRRVASRSPSATSSRTPVVVSLREDYLPDVEALRGPIASLGRNRVRLAHLDGGNALEAIVKPAPNG